MVLADDRILEYVRENQTAGSTQMADSGYVRYSQSYISKRCRKLVEHGLLEHYGNGVYGITERGERYLDGEIDTSEDVPDEVESHTDDGPSASENHEQA
nr:MULTISPECIES: MarR family transcriptional regulator [unclassified Haloarcula]